MGPFEWDQPSLLSNYEYHEIIITSQIPYLHDNHVKVKAEKSFISF